METSQEGFQAIPGLFPRDPTDVPAEQLQSNARPGVILLVRFEASHSGHEPNDLSSLPGGELGGERPHDDMGAEASPHDGLGHRRHFPGHWIPDRPLQGPCLS